jgi:hypothetical protein
VGNLRRLREDKKFDQKRVPVNKENNPKELLLLNMLMLS